ncbi:MAG: helix-turn-helix domain-containing protein [Phycisphaerales bacterium]|nr:helix-turn-helix domain-containing protein [Phycisphaerales bacterium]
MGDNGDNLNKPTELRDVLEQIEEHLAALRAGRTSPQQEWLTVTEVADELKVSRDTIERLIGSGQMKAASIETPKGRGKRSRYRVRRDWMEDFMLSKANSAPTTPRQNHRRRPRLKSPYDFIG